MKVHFCVGIKCTQYYFPPAENLYRNMRCKFCTMNFSLQAAILVVCIMCVAWQTHKLTATLGEGYCPRPQISA